MEPSIVPIQVPKIDGSLALFLAVTESACLRSANHWAVDMKTLDTYNSRVAFAQSGIPGVGCSLGSRDAGDLKKQWERTYRDSSSDTLPDQSQLAGDVQL